MSTILGNKTWNTCVMGLRPFAIQPCRCRWKGKDWLFRLCTRWTHVVDFFIVLTYSLKQQSTRRHVAPFGNIIPTSKQPVFALSPTSTWLNCKGSKTHHASISCFVQNRTTKQYHPRKFRNVQTSSNTYKYSFFPLTINDWSNLPSRGKYAIHYTTDALLLVNK
jgi:hypothetical protein